MQNRNGEKDRYPNISGKVVAGILLIGFGILLIAAKSGAYIPGWLFSWPMILIGISIVIGVTSNFRDISWLFIGIAGLAFLLPKIIPDLSIKQYIWPGLIVIAGIFLVFLPRRSMIRRSRHRLRYGDNSGTDDPSLTYKETKPPGDEEMEIVSIFAHIKKTVFTKKFRGGEVVCVFGGTDVNLMQADIEGPIVLELVQIFGGANLLVPPHWQVRSDMTAIFGGIDDKRPPVQEYESGKVIVLKGAAIFGGVVIKSY